MNVLLEPFERVRTIQGKALLLVLPPVAVLAAYHIMRQQAWLPDAAGVTLDVAATALVASLAIVLLHGLRWYVTLYG